MILTILACFCFFAWVKLAAFHGLFWKPLLDSQAPEPSVWPSLTIIVPARNEVESLPQALPTLLAQDYPGTWKVLLIDDHSEDGTGRIAREIATARGLENRLQVIEAPALPDGWGGKVAAMQTGVNASTSDYVLFTDADIVHGKNSFRRLVARALLDKLDLTSLMVKLSVQSSAEKLMIPAFIFFFEMLYPFRKIADPYSSVAGAAGGVMLVRRKALENCGGFARMRNALIDDCTLARLIKDGGGDFGSQGHIALSLTRNVKSLRPYPTFAEIHTMIARTAFVQLKHSNLLLFGSLIGLSFLFLLPLFLPVFCEWQAGLPAFASWLLMSLIYLPTVRFYGLSPFWAFTLPFASVLYMIATFDSARRTWLGVGGQWKGRTESK